MLNYPEQINCPEPDHSFVILVKQRTAIINQSPEIKIVNTSTQEYMVLVRGGAWIDNAAPEELQKILDKFQAWHETLSATGKIKAGQPLVREGKILSQKNGQIVDGPCTESEGSHRRMLPIDCEQPRGSSRRCPKSPPVWNTEIRCEDAASGGGVCDDRQRAKQFLSGRRTRTRRRLGVAKDRQKG